MSNQHTINNTHKKTTPALFGTVIALAITPVVANSPYGLAFLAFVLFAEFALLRFWPANNA